MLIASLSLPLVFLAVIVWSREESVWMNLVPSNKTTLVLGDSHAEPLELPQGITIASSGDPFFMPFFHLQRIMMNSRGDGHLNRVVLTVGPHNFSRQPEARFSDKHSKWHSGNQRRIANAFTLSDHFHYWNLPHLKLECLKQELYIFDKAIHDKPTKWNEKPVLNPNKGLNRIHRHRLHEPDWFVHKGIQMEYLMKMIDACKIHQLNLVLAETPIHETYKRHIAPSGWTTYRRTLDSIAKVHEHVSFINFEQHHWPDSLFKDADHLNSTGGRILGKELEQYTF